MNDWLVLFELNNIPCSKINTVSEALESEQAKVSKMVLEQNHPTAGRFRTLGIPYNFSKTPAQMTMSPPLLGADTDDILMKIVGLEPARINKLRKDKII